MLLESHLGHFSDASGCGMLANLALSAMEPGRIAVVEGKGGSERGSCGLIPSPWG